jgi:hypothetical protein
LRAEELVALASAHGIDLVQAARLTGSRPARDTVRRGHNGSAYTMLVPPPAQRARGSATQTCDRASWSLAELGQAAAGVPQVPFMAACYAFAGDHSVYWKLWEALERSAQDLRARYKWPAQVRGVGGASTFYLERVAQLVLDEDSNQALFNAVPATDTHPSLYALFLQIEEHVWRRGVFERFDQVKLKFQGWVAEAIHRMQPRLDELVEDGD